MLGILNTQAGDRYLFSGTAVTTPSVASMDDIMNGTTTQAGLKQVIAERKQADVGTNGLGRLVINSPTATSVEVNEDVAGSPFGLKFASVSSSLTGGGTVTGPQGSPAGVTIDLGATNPSDGDKVSFTFNMPDGTQESIALTASSATPTPAGSFAIGVDTTATAANLKTALNSAIGTLANTSLVAASAMQAGNDFFNTSGTATGSVTNNQATVPGPISGATLLSGAAGHELDRRELRGQRHHHRQRHADHLCRVGRHRQSGQRHRQYPDAAVEDRFDHGHVDALDHQRRRDFDSHR